MINYKCTGKKSNKRAEITSLKNKAITIAISGGSIDIHRGIGLTFFE